MADVLLFHHALGATPGFLDFADRVRAAGHTVHTPDLYGGRIFAELEAGVAFAEQVGFAEIVARAAEAAAGLPDAVVYAGFSLGALPAQALAQTRPGARGALLFHGGVPVSEFGRQWPGGVPLHLHVMEADPWTELDVCRTLAAEVAGARLFVYQGSGHLFAEPASPDYDAVAAARMMERTLTFLQAVEETAA